MDQQILFDRSDNDPALIGTILQSMSVTVTEALGYTPLDFLFVDCQHGPLAFERLENIFRAADLTNFPVLVRISRDDTTQITNFLDAGARGVVIPQVSSPDMVTAVSSHVRYRDGRSLGSATRAARFGNFGFGEYIRYVDKNLGLIPMIESKAGMENVDEIVSMEEVSAVLVGPGDLSYSLGLERGSDAIWKAVDEIRDVAADHACPTGTFVSTADDFHRYAESASFVIYGSDIDHLTNHYEKILDGCG